jgi:tRNA A-37 threonylcarbamoyl transferase component Bud32
LGLFDHTFVDAVSQHCSSAAGWVVESGSYAKDPWIRVSCPESPTPKQGWKLHISASEKSAGTVLRRVLPVLTKNKSNFKVARSESALFSLNEGQLGLSQIGKFLTVYPGNDTRAVHLAIQLHEQVQGLHGFRIPSDRPLSRQSLVHYRYGGFDDCFVQTPLGEILPAITTADGQLRIDFRGLEYESPTSIPDPFEAAGIAEPLRKPPRLIAKRYLIISKCYDGARGSVYYAVDVKTAKRCILKRAIREIGVSSDEDSTLLRLRKEASVLAAVAPDQRFPNLIQLVTHDDDLYLAEEEFDGDTLEYRIRELAVNGKRLSSGQFLKWGAEIAAMLDVIHNHGFVYHDLKSSNIIVSHEGGLKLIDFDCVLPAGSVNQCVGRGTPGYASPQQYAGSNSDVTDDIYSLGALYYFMATNAEPSMSPHGSLLTRRSLRMLNSEIGGDVEGLIVKCLRKDASKRFSSASDVEAELKSIDAKSPNIRLGRSKLRFDQGRYERLACDLADTLCAAAEKTPGVDGLGWRSTHDGDPVWAHDLATGSAGSLLALAELVLMFGGNRRRAILRKAARWLANVQPFADPPLPGLYVGEAGVGAALLRAGQILKDRSLVLAACRKSSDVAAIPYSSPDLYNGTAGRLRFHLLVWDATKASEHLRNAESAAEALLENVTVSGEEAFWVIPPGYESLSGTANLGYAHGAAGIADALLDLYEVTGDQRLIGVVRRVTNWLRRLAIPSLNDGSGLNWPIDLNGESFGPFWCHGAAGVGRFFLHAAHLGISDDCLNLANRAATTVSEGALWAGPTQCHGLAGNIEFLIDMFQATQEKKFLTRACFLGSVLETFAIKNGKRLSWQSETPGVVTPDYLVGYAGVSTCLLRLAVPHNMPHQLSRSGFQWNLKRGSGQLLEKYNLRGV